MNNLPLRFLGPTAALLLLGLTAAAQQQTIPDRRTVSVEFKGGSLTEYVAALRSAGNNVNVVLPDTAAKVRVPALVLRETSVEAALRAVTNVVDESIHLSVNVSVGSSPNSGPFGEPVYSMQVRQLDNNQATTAGPPSSRARLVRVFALRTLIKGAGDNTARLDVKTILTAVDTGLGVVAEHAGLDTNSSDKAVVRYHEDSGLLFVAGTNAQLSVVDQVINNLERDQKDERAAKRAATAPATKEAPTEVESPEKKKATR